MAEFGDQFIERGKGLIWLRKGKRKRRKVGVVEDDKLKKEVLFLNKILKTFKATLFNKNFYVLD